MIIIWFIRYVIVYGILVAIKHFFGFQEAVLAGFAWILANLAGGDLR